MLLYKFVGDGEDDTTEVLHLPGASGADYTLCGLSIDGDTRTLGTSRGVRGAKAVTCPDCAAIILHCRGVRVAPNA